MSLLSVCLHGIDCLDDGVAVSQHSGASWVERLDLPRRHPPGDVLVAEVTAAVRRVGGVERLLKETVRVGRDLFGSTAHELLVGIWIGAQVGVARGSVWKVDAAGLVEGFQVGFELGSLGVVLDDILDTLKRHVAPAGEEEPGVLTVGRGFVKVASLAPAVVVETWVDVDKVNLFTAGLVIGSVHGRSDHLIEAIDETVQLFS